MEKHVAVRRVSVYAYSRDLNFPSPLGNFISTINKRAITVFERSARGLVIAAES